VVKFNPQNQAQWAHRITTSPPVSGNKANSIDVDNHSHLYISGWYGINADFGNGIALNSTSSKNGYIARYDINGNVIWAKSSDSLVIYNHQVVTDTNSITVIESSPDKFINYDQNGNVVSSRTVTLLSPGSGSYFNQLVAHKGKYFVTGTIYDSLYIDGVNYQFPGYNAFVGCFDASDSLIWIRAIQNSSYCQSFDISIDSQDHIYMTGSYGPHDTINQTVVMPWWGSSDVLFVKLCNGAVSLNEASGNEMVQLFPNPVSSELNVRFYDSGFISVFDVLGNLVFELDVADRQVDELELDVSFLNSGIYFVRVGDRIGKFVKQ
jgi:hypothetical protein